MDRLLNTTEAAHYLRLARGTLENYRIAGVGPQFIQRTRRGRVFYDRADLDAWLDRQKKQSTSQ
jgi:hypothetical protein